MAIGSSLPRAALIGSAGLLLVSCSAGHAPAAQPSPSTGFSSSVSPSPASPSPAKPSPSPAVSSPSPSASSPGTAGSPGTVPAGYSEYTNPRFGFATFWPSSFTAQPPPVDGDGLAWASPDGLAELTAYGSNNVLNESPRQDESADSRGLSVVYTDITGNIVTVSGYKDNGRIIVYQRDVVGPGSIDTLYWRYPTSQKTRWDATVTLTAHAFRPGNVTTGH